MQENSMAMKARVLFDGEEVPGLVRLGEVALENAAIDVPSFRRIRKVHTGVTTIPEVELSYEVQRGTDTLRFFQDYYSGGQKKDVTVIYCDADGVEYARDLWQDVECRRLVRPQVDLANVSYAQVSVVLLPYDIVPV
jgi:hypothetical protein